MFRGDINNIPCAKQAFTGGIQAEYLGASLGDYVSKVILKGIKTASDPIEAEKFFKAPKAMPNGLFMAFGPANGLGQFGNTVLGHFIVKMAKSKELFIGKNWKLANSTMPK